VSWGKKDKDEWAATATKFNEQQEARRKQMEAVSGKPRDEWAKGAEAVGGRRSVNEAASRHWGIWRRNVKEPRVTGEATHDREGAEAVMSVYRRCILVVVCSILYSQHLVLWQRMVEFAVSSLHRILRGP
jgi:hypothetical protein